MPSSSEGSANGARTDLYFGLFRWVPSTDGACCTSRHEARPDAIPCPTTGRLLQVATVEAQASAICPACGHFGRGGFVSFTGDLRMAYACPECRQLIWLRGA